MVAKVSDISKEKYIGDGYEKLLKINNPDLHAFITRFVELCNPDKVFVCADTPDDI